MSSWLASIAATSARPHFGVSVLKSTEAAPYAAPVSASKPHVDRSKMCVTAVLTTRTPDRQGDIVDPTGGDFSEHMTNPVVMFHHGKDHRLPIGKAEDPDGNYTVRLVKARDGDLLIGTTHFAQSNRFAQDVFGLVAEDILRGVSIGFDPLTHEDSVEELGVSPILERPALHFKGWKLLEYSHTPIGVNRDALTVAVQKSLDGSRKLHPVLERVLKPFATPRRATVTVPRTLGVNKAMDMDDDQDDTGMGTPDDDTDPGATSGDQYDPATDDPNDDPNLPQTGQIGGTSEEDTPPTVKALLDGSQGLMDLAAQLEDAAKRGEHPGGRKFIQMMCQKLRTIAATMQQKGEGIHGELSGPLPDGGEGDDDAAPEEPEPDGDQNADEDDGEPAEPPTDEDGAVVTKGLDYSPRRFTFNDVSAPIARAGAAIGSTGTPQRLKALEDENAKLKAALENVLADAEAGERRRSR